MALVSSQDDHLIFISNIFLYICQWGGIRHMVLSLRMCYILVGFCLITTIT